MTLKSLIYRISCGFINYSWGLAHALGLFSGVHPQGAGILSGYYPVEASHGMADRNKEVVDTIGKWLGITISHCVCKALQACMIPSIR